MSFTTPNDLIELALKDSGVLGVGQTASAEDANDALNRLNMMLGQWQRKRWLVYGLTDSVFATTGAEFYTVGAGGNFNIPRPDKIESAFFRQFPSDPNTAVDYPLELIRAREDYNQIRVKGIGSFAGYLFYESSFPLGKVYPWPNLPSGFDLHITTKTPLGKLTLNTPISLPDEYFNAIFYNLCVRLRPAYRMPVDAVLVALAKDALNTLRVANAQIPRLRMPSGLPGMNGSGFPIYSSDTT